MSLPFRALTAGLVLVATASPGHAALSEFFTPGPRIDLALEMEYHTWVGSTGGPDGFVRMDGVVAERYEEYRLRIARAYLDGFADALADVMLTRIPFLQALERRYRDYSEVRLLGPDGSDPGGGDEPNLQAGVLRDDPTPFSLRLRLNTFGDGLDIAPGFLLVRGKLEWRLAYRPLRERVEMRARRPLTERLALELTGGQAVDGRETEVILGLIFTF